MEVLGVARYDLGILNGTLVIPGAGLHRADVLVQGGRVAAIVDTADTADVASAVDATGKLVFPGAVDGHFHIGIYRPIPEDAESETRSALVGGVTTVISYFRTGGHYLEKSGPYRDIFPEVLAATSGHAYTDYAYHLGLMTSQQVSEVDWLVREAGVSSFKYYMFYKGLNLSGSSTDTSSLTMSDVYDLGHLYRIMQAVAAAAERYGASGRVSLSLHCEHSEIMRTLIEEVRALGAEGLEAYHLARPPFQERLAIAEATLLADVTGCPVNLLHLSSGEALAGGLKAQRDYPSRDIRLETTLHHLALTYDRVRDLGGKVNPPIRTSSDVEALWQGVLAGEIEQIVSDHACCTLDHKGGGTWDAYAGFGGTGLLYPVTFSEGTKRGLTPERVAELVSTNPARNFGLYPRKGTIAVGSDADLAIIDPDLEAPVTTDRLLSAQDYTPFEGFLVKGWPTHTIRAGQVQFANGELVGNPDGRYLKRPDAMHATSAP
jgi:dihydroorotase-like cyclic amidohydrolase